MQLLLSSNRSAEEPAARASASREVPTSITALVPALRTVVPELLDDVERELRPLDRTYAELLVRERTAVVTEARAALLELVRSAERRLADRRPPPRQEAARALVEHEDAGLLLFESAGRDHFRRGRPLSRLLAAYQTGGRVAWRHIAAAAVGLGLSAEVLAVLAEEVFRAVDRIGAASTAGYLREQTEAADMRRHWQAALAEQLLLGGAEPAALAELARRAAWPLPERAALALAVSGEQVGQGPTAAARLARVGLPVRTTPVCTAIVADPDGPAARRRLAAALEGYRCVVGPVVPLADLAESVLVAQDAAWALHLPETGSAPYYVDDHLDAIIVHRNPQLLAALRGRCLAPLRAASPGSRKVLEGTLRAWLLHMGDIRATAAELAVHPQTVRYRMSRLRELFGTVLDDPGERLRLLLALGWEAPVVAAGRGEVRRLPAGAAGNVAPLERRRA